MKSGWSGTSVYLCRDSASPNLYSRCREKAHGKWEATLAAVKSEEGADALSCPSHPRVQKPSCTWRASLQMPPGKGGARVARVRWWGAGFEYLKYSSSFAPKGSQTITLGRCTCVSQTVKDGWILQRILAIRHLLKLFTSNKMPQCLCY